jgi:ATP-dependent protease ClpP protease subunit
MKEILIDDEIGYDWWSDSGITLKSVNAQLEGLSTGEEIKITINSPGGSVYEGFTIFNRIRELARSHSISVRIDCLAASVASYIALAARSVDIDAKITVSGNSVFMIHNPWGCACGDYRELKSKAEYYEKLAAAYGAVHSVVAGKPESEIRAAMDAETFYVGKEIHDAGFANDYEQMTLSETPADGASSDGALFASQRDMYLVNAKIAYDKAEKKEYSAMLQNKEMYLSGIEKAAAMLKTDMYTTKAQAGVENIKVGGNMTTEELLAKDKALYDAVFTLGEKAGTEKERARVNAHILLGEKAGSLAISAKHIKSGVFVTEDAVQAEYIAANMDKARIDARIGDNPGDTCAGSGGDVDDVKLATAFDKGASGKNLEGKSWTE